MKNQATMYSVYYSDETYLNICHSTPHVIIAIALQPQPLFDPLHLPDTEVK